MTTTRDEQNKMRRFFKAWAPSLVVMAVIFILSSQSELPGPPSPLVDRILKDLGHAFGYGLLATTYAWALEQSGVRRVVPVALLLTLLYALSDEWHQTFVPGRSGNLLDILIDLSGGVIALVVWQRLKDREQLDRSP